MSFLLSGHLIPISLSTGACGLQVGPAFVRPPGRASPHSSAPSQVDPAVVIKEISSRFSVFGTYFTHPAAEESRAGEGRSVQKPMRVQKTKRGSCWNQMKSPIYVFFKGILVENQKLGC